MEVKKTKRADLETSKVSSYLMGLTIGLAALFVGFEWGTQEVRGLIDTGIVTIQQEELVEITRQEETPPPPPPPAPQQVIAEVLDIVEDDVKLDQQEIASSEDNSKAAQVQTYVAAVAAAPQQEEEESAHEIFAIVEEMPQYPGGDVEMLKFLMSNIKYPVIAQENGVSGRVSVQFVVNRDGSVVDAVVARGVDPSLDKEALRVVNSMPKWTPGKQRGKPVRVRYTVPVTFRLQ